jgi:TIR domain
MPDIFISYRREDSGPTVASISRWLRQSLPPGDIYHDVVSISPGTDWEPDVEHAICQSHIILVVIGPHWATISNEDGKRIKQDDDIVRREVALALTLHAREQKIVIPLLVDGASMPSEQALPTSLKELCALNRKTIENEPHFERSMEELGACLAEKRSDLFYLERGANEARLLYHPAERRRYLVP